MYSDKFEVHIVELPKLNEHEYPETTLLKWARFLRAEKKEEFEVIAKTDPYIEETYRVLQLISADDEKRLEYEARQRAILDHNQLMKDNFQQGYAEGEANGYAEGEANGYVKGEADGIEQGIKALVETCQELGITIEAAAKKVQEKFSVSEENARRAVRKYWTE